MKLLCITTLLLISGKVLSQTQDLYIAGLFPFTGAWPGGDSMLAATQIALDLVNDRNDILPGYKLNMVYNDTQFSPYIAVRVLHRLLRSSPTKIAVFGTGSSESTVATATVSEPYNIPQISRISVTPVLSNKDLYPGFFRTIAPDPALNAARIALFKQLGWTKVATINHNRPVNNVMVRIFQEQLEQNGITVLAAEVYDGDPTQHLQRIKNSGARIIFEAGTTGVEIFCPAYKLGMYGSEYVWSNLGWFADNWWKEIPDGSDCTDEQKDMVAEGTMWINEVLSNPSGEAGISGLTPDEIGAAYTQRTNGAFLVGKSLMQNSFDSVWALALALNATETQLQSMVPRRSLQDFTYEDEEMGQRIRNNLKETDFIGFKSRISFDVNHDIIPTLQVQRIQSLTIQTVGLYNSDSDEIEWSTENPIVWEDGKVPADSDDSVVPVDPCSGAARHTGAGLALLLTTMTFCLRL